MNIVTAALNSLPAILALIQAERARTNPGEPAPTDAEVFAALREAVGSVVAKGDAWKASHPVEDVSGSVPA